MFEIHTFYKIIVALGIIMVSILYIIYKLLTSKNPIFIRRSVVNYSSKKVPDQIINDAIKAAISAPNHFLSEPWRFYLCGKKVKNEIINLNPSKKDVFLEVPYWMVVTMKSKHAMYEKLHFEDYAACACACQNFMVYLASKGIGSKWVTGALGIKETEILRTVSCGLGEKFIGIIWFGYPTKNLLDIQAPTRNIGMGVLKYLD